MKFGAVALTLAPVVLGHAMAKHRASGLGVEDGLERFEGDGVVPAILDEAAKFGGGDGRGGGEDGSGVHGRKMGISG